MADRKKKPLSATRKSNSSLEKSDSGLSASLLAGSEEIFEFFCQPCSTKNLHLEAVGYCQQCKEYLCDNCCRYHRKTTATRHHALLDKTDMPKSKMILKPRDELTETCLKHPDKVLDYFCKTHNQPCCVACLNTDHRSCKLISHIPDVSDGISSGSEYKHLMADLNALVSKVTKQQEKIRRSSHDNEKYQSEALASIRDFRKEVDKLLDTYEENAVMKLSKINHENSEKIKVASSECQSILSDVTAMIAGLDAKAKDGKNNQLFVDIKLSRERLSAIEAEKGDATECRISRYEFHRDEKIKEMVSTLSAVWSLSIRQDGEETKARYIREVRVKSDDDKKDCLITGIAALPGDRIVVTDCNNKSIKLVDVSINKVTSRLSLSSKPCDVTTTKPNQVAVSLGDKGKIEILTVTQSLSKSSVINVNGVVFSAFCFDGEKFILICAPTRAVRMVDMSGKVLSTISTDKNGDQLFTKPWCISLGRDKDVVYITNREANTVTTMTPRGKVISVYRNDSLKYPAGVTVGTDDRVYVCSEDTHTVHQLSATGEFLQILLDEKRGLSSYPHAIAHNGDKERLYISSANVKPEKCNYVKLFQLE